MKMVEQHEIDTIARRRFKNWLPASWVIREQNPDYGIDYEIEIFRGGVPTGVFFSVQLKGTRSADYHDKALHFPFEVDKLDYYLRRVPKPVYLVVVDIVAEKAFWICTQRYTQEVIEKENPDWHNQQRITVRIPLTNDLACFEKLEKSARRDVQYVFLLQFGIPHWTIVAQIQGILDDPQAIEEAVNRYRQQQTEMGLHVALLYAQAGERPQAVKRLLTVLEETAEKELSNDFLKAAIMLAYNLPYVEKKDNRLAAGYLDSALQRSDKCSDPSLLFLARGFRAFLEFLYRFRNARDLELLAQVAEPHGRGTDAILQLFQIEEEQTLFEARRDLLQVISEAITNHEFVVTCQLMVHLADTNLFAYPFVRLRFGRDKAASLLEPAADGLHMALELAKAINQPEMTCFVLQSQANLLYMQDDSRYRDVLDEMQRIAIENGLKASERAAAALKAGLEEGFPWPEGPVERNQERELTDEEELEFIHDLIKRAGIDLQDENDEIAKIVRIGLRDRNPERVLKFCRHLHVATGSYGIPGEMLGLPTAGSKFLFCDLANMGVYGLELDRLLEDIQGRYCAQCKSREPHLPEWKWSRQWQQDQERNRPAAFQKFIDSL